jgi:sterol desaturase/sphingolipid hydroxylase (fatty acid hydroxylase superfamily)
MPTLFVTLLFLTMAVLERLLARRRGPHPRLARWGRNLAALALGQLASRACALVLLAPVFAWSARNGYGWRSFVTAPDWLETGVSLLAFDGALYAWHRINHTVPFLWRWHRFHHADVDMDVSTALRFHPVELILSAAFRIPFLLLLGLSPGEAVWFDFAVTCAAIFHHADLDLGAGAGCFPARFELRRVHTSLG